MHTLKTIRKQSGGQAGADAFVRMQAHALLSFARRACIYIYTYIYMYVCMYIYMFI